MARRSSATTHSAYGSAGTRVVFTRPRTIVQKAETSSGADNSYVFMSLANTSSRLPPSAPGVSQPAATAAARLLTLTTLHLGKGLKPFCRLSGGGGVQNSNAESTARACWARSLESDAHGTFLARFPVLCWAALEGAGPLFLEARTAIAQGSVVRF